MKLTQLMPDEVVLQELSVRLKRVRKQQGFSQDVLAEMAGIGVATLRRMEDGQDAQMGSWIKVMRALQMMDALDQLLPEDYLSPRAEAQAQEKRSRRKPNSNPGIKWGDEQP